MQAPAESLRRVLSLTGLLLFGLAYLVPLTVFTTFGVASLQTGGRTTVAYLITFVAMMFTAHSYAVMGRAFPVAGSVFAYARHGFGARAGFLAGWALLLDYLFMPMINYLVIGIYVTAAFPAIPQWSVMAAFLAVVTGLNLAGVESLHRANAVIIGAQAVFVVVFVGAGLNHALTSAPVAYALPFTGSHAYAAAGADPSLGMAPLFAGAAVLCLSFLGFDAVSTMAEEAREPTRDVPRAIMLVTFVGGLLFIALAYVAQLSLPVPSCLPAIDPACNFGDNAALDVLAALGGPWLKYAFLATYGAGCFGSALTAQASVSRILLSMGRQGALPRRFFGHVTPGRAVPSNAIWCVSALTLAFFWIDLTTLVSMISFGALVAFSTVNLSAIRHYLFREGLRGTRNLLVYGLAPGVGALLSIWLWTSLQRLSLIIGLAWLGLGVAWLLLRKEAPAEPVDPTHQ